MHSSVLLKEGSVVIQAATQHSGCDSLQERKSRTVCKGRCSKPENGNVLHCLECCDTNLRMAMSYTALSAVTQTWEW